MNPKLVEEVAVALERADDMEVPNGISDGCKNAMVSDWSWFLAQAAIRVCMARAAEIAEANIGFAKGEQFTPMELFTASTILDDIKREGGLT